MPARPVYFHRISEAVAVFRRLPSEWVDRRTLEETLGVSKTVAWRIMRRCGATDGPGGALICGRADLVAALEGLMQSPAVDQELRRRDRLDRNLGGMLAAARSRHVRIAPDDDALKLVSTRFAKLPKGIELKPGRLTMEFRGTKDFLEKVGALVYALQNDYDAISAFLDEVHQ